MGPPIPYGLTRASWRRGMRDLDDAGRLLALPNPPVNFILLLYAELISMYTIHLPRRARKHYLAGDPPFLNDFSRDEVHQLFGFRTRAQLRRVMNALGVPAMIRTRERYVYPGAVHRRKAKERLPAAPVEPYSDRHLEFHRWHRTSV